ncbi:MAG: hypothetical protein JKY04_07460, partial [Sneathiella sp.]|nr:hypothetical protein [Sneathiella sp.]
MKQTYINQLSAQTKRSEKLRQLLSFVDGPAFIMAVDGKLIFTNKAFSELIYGTEVPQEVHFSQFTDEKSCAKINLYIQEQDNFCTLEIGDVSITSPTNTNFRCRLRCMKHDDILIIQTSMVSEPELPFILTL